MAWVPFYPRMYQGLPHDYGKAGRFARRLMGETFSKADHLARGQDLLEEARRLQRTYSTHVERELRWLADRGVDPGPLISGVVSDKFSASVKDGLRQMAHGITLLHDAAMAHYAAAGKRISTFRAALQRNPRRR